MKKEKAHLSARIIAMLFLLGFFIIKSSEDRLRHNETLDLTGKDTFWKVSLNINWGYNTILRVAPRREMTLSPLMSRISRIFLSKLYTADINLIFCWNKAFTADGFP